MNNNRNEILTNKGKQILLELGSIINYIEEQDDCSIEKRKLVYNDYNIIIESEPLPKTGGDNFIKIILSDINIFYRNNYVFRSEEDLYFPGNWECILDVIYNNIPLLKEKQKDDSVIERGSYLWRNVISKVDKLKLCKNSNIDIIPFYSYGLNEDSENVSVYFNGSLVFHYIDDCNKGEVKVPIYVEGEWENQLKQMLYDYYKKRDKALDDSDNKVLKRLIKIK